MKVLAKHPDFQVVAKPFSNWDPTTSRTVTATMLREVERAHWIAPALSSGAGFLEPLQCGGVKTMGIHKPWSPTRSYGLLVRLDRNLRPVASFHSRANGRRHGITSAVEHDGRVLVTSKGGNAILQLAVMP